MSRDVLSGMIYSTDPRQEILHAILYNFVYHCIPLNTTLFFS